MTGLAKFSSPNGKRKKFFCTGERISEAFSFIKNIKSIMVLQKCFAFIKLLTTVLNHHLHKWTILIAEISDFISATSMLSNTVLFK